MGRTIRAIAVVWLVTGTSLFASTGSGAAAAACGAWHVVPSASVGTLHNELDSISAVNSTNAWAVGRFDSNATADRTLVERWNGAKWAVVASPEANASHNELVGVDALSVRSVWAVGHYFLSHDRTLIEHWNGSSWRIVPSPNVGTDHNELDAVAALSRTNAWAVGYYFNGTHDRTLIEHWNGRRWSVVPSPNVGSNHNVLKGVATSSRSSVFAVGLSYDGTSDRTLVEHWNGSRWSVQKTPNVGPKHNELDAVAVEGPNSVWAVGRSYDGTADQTLIERFNGLRWSVVTSPNVGGPGGSEVHNELDGVGAVAGSAASVWAVGTAVPTRTYQTLVEHFDGSKWVVVASPNQGTAHNELHGVASFGATKALAVGLFFNGTSDRTLAARLC